MKSLNRVTLMGRVGNDPDVRTTSNNTRVANFSMATSQVFVKDGEKEEKTQWHRVVVWAKLAEIVESYLKKGQPVYVEGRLETKQWEDKEGITRYTTEIVAENIILLGGKPQDDEGEEAEEKPKTPAAKGKTDTKGAKKNFRR